MTMETKEQTENKSNPLKYWGELAIKLSEEINELKEKITTWMIMLDTTAFDGNDAGMVRDEMKELLK